MKGLHKARAGKGIAARMIANAERDRLQWHAFGRLEARADDGPLIRNNGQIERSWT
jgi:hypothetical protein